MELILMWLTLRKGLALVENGTYLVYHVVMGLHVFGLTIKIQMIMYLIGTGWPIVDATPIAPPYVRRTPRRPKKLRRKANDESVGSTRKKRNQHTITCTRCKSICNNKRSCKGKTAADRRIPKGGNKGNCNMNQPGPSATTRHAPTATSKGPATTDTKGPAATGPSGLKMSPRKRKNANTIPNVN
ncbi:hypothetical protein QL285_030515 [Trifolium repens]|nr:hypothetical protein QL285_030515 [Trifolium repens]